MELKNLNLEQLNKQAELLGKEYDRINNWIENNPNTDPNLYEMVSCEVDFAELTKAYYEKNKDIDHYSITSKIPALAAVCDKLDHMYELRTSHQIFEDNKIKRFFRELHMRSRTAEYVVSDDETTNMIKKEILCRTAGIYLYIWQETTKNPEYRYDNIEEFETLKSNIEIYNDGRINQFSREVGVLIDSINENYLYKEEKQPKIK